MSIATFAQYKTQLREAAVKYPFSKGSFTSGVIGGLTSSWILGPTPPAGATPTTSAALDRTTTGAFPIPASSTNLRLLRGQAANGRVPAGVVLFADRLVHSGGLSGTSTSAQTTNLPTAALTRFTSGVGVLAALEIYSSVGSTATTAQISYTNSAGTSGRTSPLFTFGGTGYNSTTRFIICPLDPADDGVRAVASVTLTATTGTAGNFGVTLFKPILATQHQARDTGLSVALDAFMNSGSQFDIADPGACIWLLVAIGSSSSATFTGDIEFAED